MSSPARRKEGPSVERVLWSADRLAEFLRFGLERLLS
jgi:hypothetical protein